MTKLTRAQTNELAWRVMSQAANLVEFSEMLEGSILEDADPRAVRAQLAKWMAKLPGDMWDTRLGPAPGR